MESAVSRSAMLTTAQPNGRRYCTLHRFFFSPAPILPARRGGGGVASVRTATTGGSREEEEEEETPTYSDDVYDDVDVFPQVAAP